MSSLGEHLHRALGDLTELGVRAALVGGLAVSVRTEPRFTRDNGLAVAVTDDTEAEAVVARMRQRGWGIGTVLEHEPSRRLPTVRLHPPGEPSGGVVVDLLFASSGIEPEIVAAADEIDVFPDVRVPVASTAHLLVLKLLARTDPRPQDQADIRALMAVADADDLAEARSAASMVVDRGFDRGRPLVDEVKGLRG